jgi:hypothetical protein
MVSLVNSNLTPLAAANGNGLGGGCKTTKDASNGNAVFESKNYTITTTSNSDVTIFNKQTGNTTLVTGDPHVYVNGKHAFDFKETLTYVLNDGTKVTIDTAKYDDAGATVASRVTITNQDANYGVQVYGAALNDGQDITFAETLDNGFEMDQTTADNNVVWEGAAEFMEMDLITRQMVAVDQKRMNDAEARTSGGMFDPNQKAANDSPPPQSAAAQQSPPSTQKTSANVAKDPQMAISLNPAQVTSIGTDFMSRLNSKNGTFDASKVDINDLFTPEQYNGSGYSVSTSGGTTVTVSQPMGAGEEVNMTIKDPSGIEVRVQFDSVDGGKYEMTGFQWGNLAAVGIPASTERILNENLKGAGAGGLMSLLDLVKMASKTKKDGGDAAAAAAAGGVDISADGTGGLSGAQSTLVESGPSTSEWGEDSWFIQMAEGMGEIVNKIAEKLKKLVDDAKLGESGQPPFKEGMVIQGLAQQLSFIMQAMMTALNSLGDAIKSSVTAGGAAR